jgi:hypothetical protein
LKQGLIFILIFLASCSYFFDRKNERVLARVYDDYLYESDLKEVVPPGTAPEDSAILARNFIDAWVRQKLLIRQAQNNLTEEQMDFTRQLENYKNSLLIFEYEHELVNQKLDTIISDEEIETYYSENKSNFLLKENIVQMQYVKLPLNSNNTRQFKQLIYSDESADKTRLSELAEKYAADYFLDNQNWLLFNDVMAQIPIKTYNQEEYLKNHQNLEVRDSLYYYIVRFKDFRIKETISPLSLEKDRIRNIILNKRKMEMINKMREDLYNNALKKHDFEIFGTEDTNKLP